MKSGEILPIITIGVMLIAVAALFLRIAVRVRKRGGSLTTIGLGATYEFMNEERRKASEIIVDLKAGKKHEDPNLKGLNLLDARTRQPIDYDAVADIYDAYVVADFDIPFWLSQAGAVKGKILELACGTGRVSIPLLRAGADLTCVDYAPEMLARFREKLETNHLECPVFCQDISELEIPGRFDMIFIPFHSFSELVDEDKRRAALERILDHLTSDGVFICTLQNPVVRTASMDGQSHLLGEFALPHEEKLAVYTRLIFDPASQLAEGEQSYDSYDAEGKLFDHRCLDVRFYLFYRNQFELLASMSGFEVVGLYGDYNCIKFMELSSPFMIWKLKRRV